MRVQPSIATAAWLDLCGQVVDQFDERCMDDAIVVRAWLDPKASGGARLLGNVYVQQLGLGSSTPRYFGCPFPTLR